MKKTIFTLALVALSLVFTSCDVLPFRGDGVVKVACIGDSLTSDQTWPEDCYPKFLSEILSDYHGKNDEIFEVRNFGFDGATLTGWGNRNGNACVFSLERYKNSLEYKPDIVVIMLGTNDAARWSAAEPTYESSYKDLLKSYRKKNRNVKFVIMMSPPHNYPVHGLYALENEVVPLQKKIAEDEGAYILDVNKLFHDYDRPNFNSLLREDKLHINADGNMYIAENLAELIVLSVHPMV